jgi:hypothetical protein
MPLNTTGKCWRPLPTEYSSVKTIANRAFSHVAIITIISHSQGVWLKSSPTKETAVVRKLVQIDYHGCSFLYHVICRWWYANCLHGLWRHISDFGGEYIKIDDVIIILLLSSFFLYSDGSSSLIIDKSVQLVVASRHQMLLFLTSEYAP